MRKNKDLRILGNGDLETVANAKALARIWSMWVPHLFRNVNVSFSTYDPIDRESGDKDLLLYTGGADSTYNLLMRREAGLKQSLLTLQGLDYKIHDSERFEKMIAKTSAFCNEMECDRIFLQSNAYGEYKKYKIDTDLSHCFVLASALFLLGRSFRTGVISSDDSREQEFLSFPWGSNSVTNAYFKSDVFEMQTANLDITRAHKLERISKNKLALDSLIFCGRTAMRPENCGVCSKCMRTKAMFVAATGKIPDIFLDCGMTRAHVDKFDISKVSERAFFMDLIEMAETNDRVAEIPGLDSKISKLRKPPFKWPRWTRWIQRIPKSLLAHKIVLS